MRVRLAALVLVELSLAVPAAAQQPVAEPKVPRLELVFGFGNRTDPSTARPRFAAPRSNGYASLDWNLNRHAALVFTVPTIAVPGDLPIEYSWLAGTRIRFGHEHRLMPFAQVLGGPARGRVRPIATLNARDPAQTRFQCGVGGGLDARLTDRFLWRVVQIEEQLLAGDAGYATTGLWTGIVVRFGARD